MEKTTEAIRLNKYIAQSGYCSRREADRLIEQGEVTVNGQTVSQGVKVTPEDEVKIGGQSIGQEEEKVMIALNKPRGVVCTTDRRWGDTLLEDIVDYPARLFPVGRLDKDSEGLILMTNEGDLLNKIMKAGNYHEKEYLVKVDKEINLRFIEKMSKGVYLRELDQTTRPCRVDKTGRKCFRIILTQGLNRQIRRMCSELGYTVQELKRVRIMDITLGELQTGQYRILTDEEMNNLRGQLKSSSNNTELRYQ